MTDDELVQHEWMLPRRWKWRREPGWYGQRRVVHIKTARPDIDGRDRQTKWPAACGVDIRFGHDTDAPLNHGTPERACTRCVASVSRETGVAAGERICQ